MDNGPLLMANTKVKQSHPFERIEEWGVTSLHGVPLHINHMQPPLFLDGCGLDVEDDEQGNFVGLGIYGETVMRGGDRVCFYWSDWELAKRLIIPKFIAHNGISDVRKLQQWGFKIDESWLLYDTQLMAHILDSSRQGYSLTKLTQADLGYYYPSYEEICGKKKNKNHKTFKDFPPEHVAEKNACDTYYCYQLYLKQTKSFELKSDFHKEAGRYYETIEAPAAVVFHSMQERGVRLDVPYLKTLEQELSRKKEAVEKEIKNELGDINLNSPKQLLEALHAKEIYPEFKGKSSTDKRALERLRSNGYVELLLKFSELSTLLSSFVDPYLQRNTEIVHPNFLQTGTRTGRPSCSNPNLLQIPRKTENGKLVRRMFIPREDCRFGELDYGQIEPCLLAHLSKDSQLCGMFNSGIDFHAFTADKLQITREAAKVLNLSVGYRATFKSVSQQLKCSDQEAQRQIDAWWSAFPQLYAWQTKLIWQAKRDGYFTTLMGRRIRVDNLNEHNKWKREHAERQLINNIAQASATEVMKKAMIEVHKHSIPILVQVYDSLLIEEAEDYIEEAVGLTHDLMINTTKLNVPLTVDVGIGDNLAACKKETK